MAAHLMTLLATLLALSTQSPGPVLPAGSSLEFMEAAVAVEEKLEKSDFAGAAKLAHALPKHRIWLKWDDRKVPAALRKEFAAQRDKALAVWQSVTKAQISIGNQKPDIAFSFEPVLAKAAGADHPAGAAVFVSSAAGEPRVEVVIGLKRGSPPTAINVENVHNEVAHAIGAYFGVATTMFGGSFMGRSELNQSRATMAVPAELGLATKTLRIADEIRAAIKEKRTLTATRPRASFHPSSIDLGAITQGDEPEFEVQVTNTGNSPLELRIAPDCFCLVASRFQAVEPGASVVLKGTFDSTKTQPGHADHKLYFTTNDIEGLARALPIRAKIGASYRFLGSASDVVLFEGTSVTKDYYLALNPASGIRPVNASISGMRGSVSLSPWSGTMADAGMGEGPLPRTGYRVRVTLQGPVAPGRSPVDVVIKTDHEKFPSLIKRLSVQQGIAALPVSTYLGEIGKAPRTSTFLVSRPGKPFKVKSVTSDWEHVKGSAERLAKGDEYRVTLKYDGKARSGPVQATITVATDDPKQPRIDVPVRGTVR